jgi:hypothetical protein
MNKNHHHDFSLEEIHEREIRAQDYIIFNVVRTGRGIDDVMGKPEPLTLLTLPIRVPYDALKRIVETFIPRNLSAPTYTRYDG